MKQKLTMADIHDAFEKATGLSHATFTPAPEGETLPYGCCTCAALAVPHWHIHDWHPSDEEKEYWSKATLICDTWKDVAAEHHRSCPYRQGIPNCTCGE